MVDAIAARDMRNATSAVASLSRLSPSRMETMRRGIPTFRAIVVAATASGGDTTAPSASAAAMLMSGITHQATRPTNDRGEDDRADREDADRLGVGADVDQRRADRRGVEQRR